MGLVISNNTAAINAWRNLSVSNTALSKSLEKLSSGLSINRGSDNPAGLVISQKLRAQTSGIQQALSNSEDAVSVIQVAEGALQEVHSVLNNIRSLAVHAANQGVNDSDSTAADQNQVDNAIDAVSRIANTTKFLGKFLLNGGAGNTVAINDSNQVSSVSLSTVYTSGYMDYVVSSAASKATLVLSGNMWSSNFVYTGSDTITINGFGFAVISGNTAADVVSKIIARSADTGVAVSINSNNLEFSATAYGAQHGINAIWGSSNTSVSVASTLIYTVGADITGTIGGQAATGNGLTLTATGANWSGSSITFKTAGNTTNGGVTQSTDITVTKSNLRFVIGGNATSAETITFSINDMRATALGSSTNGYLDNSTNGIKTGQGNSLSNNASNAVNVIDDAIAMVSNERSKLGAYQKNSIETVANSLGSAMENLTAASSRITDLDMAKEMMNFTKNQILVQAGTAMLAQANTIPQSALTLINRL